MRQLMPDFSKAIVCIAPFHGGKVTFDPSKATLLHSNRNSDGYGSYFMDYYFKTGDKRKIRLSFQILGLFFETLGNMPVLHEFEEKDMRSHLSISGCPLQVIEQHFGSQVIS